MKKWPSPHPKRRGQCNAPSAIRTEAGVLQRAWCVRHPHRFGLHIDDLGNRYDRREADRAERYWLPRDNASVTLQSFTDAYVADLDRTIRTLELLYPDDKIRGYDGFGAPLYAHQLPPEGQE